MEIWKKIQAAPKGGKLHLGRRKPVTEAQTLLSHLKDMPPEIRNNVRARLLKIAKAYVGSPTARKIAAGLKARGGGSKPAAAAPRGGPRKARTARAVRID